jgi:hypothetical protein
MHGGINVREYFGVMVIYVVNVGGMAGVHQQLQFIILNHLRINQN